MDQTIQTITVYILPVIFAITLHEAAHGYVARYFGDPTAFLAGRISLNPLRHIDPFGTVILPLLILLVSYQLAGVPFIFGWAKPVPVNFGKLREPKRDMMWVALAGPAMNLLMAIGWGVLLKLLLVGGVSEPFFSDMAVAGMAINVMFMLLNLLPIPPLDGGRVAVSLLPVNLAWRYARIEPYGFFVVILLLQLPAFRAIFYPLINMTLHLLELTFALN